MVSEIFGHIIRIVWSSFNDNIPPKYVDKQEILPLYDMYRVHFRVAYKPVLGKWFPPVI